MPKSAYLRRSCLSMDGRPTWKCLRPSLLFAALNSYPHISQNIGTLRTLIPKAHSGLQSLFDGDLTHHKFPIDCKKLAAFGVYDRKERKNGYLCELFTMLDEIDTPVIYWFEALNDVEAERQFKLITSFGKKQKRASKKIRRVVPLPNGNTTDSKTLYVGKREGGIRKKDKFSNIADRIEQHLGYNTNGMNQGLQLAHWNDGELTINIVKLSSDAAPYLTALELLLAIELMPRLGRH